MTKVFAVNGAEISSNDSQSLSSPTNQLDEENKVAKNLNTHRDIIKGRENEIKIPEQTLETINLEEDEPSKRMSRKGNFPTDDGDNFAFQGRNAIFTVPDHPITGNNGNKQSSRFSWELEKQKSEASVKSRK